MTKKAEPEINTDVKQELEILTSILNTLAELPKEKAKRIVSYCQSFINGESGYEILKDKLKDITTAPGTFTSHVWEHYK